MLLGAVRYGGGRSRGLRLYKGATGESKVQSALQQISAYTKVSEAGSLWELPGCQRGGRGRAICSEWGGASTG